MLMPHPHAAPPQHRSARTPGTWAEDHDLSLWSKGANTPDGAGCPLTVGERGRSTEQWSVSMHLMVLDAP